MSCQVPFFCDWTEKKMSEFSDEDQLVVNRYLLGRYASASLREGFREGVKL